MLLCVLAFDCAGYFDGLIPAGVAAIVALIVAILALILDPRVRGALP